VPKNNIIGLGSAGCNIAKEFMKYPQYKVYLIDRKKEKKANFYALKDYNHPELYEKNIPQMKTFFRSISGEVLFILSGAGIVSGAALVILEQIKHCNIKILYVSPDIELLGTLKRTQEKIVFNVLQEYARSAVFKEIILVDNVAIEKILGGLSLVDYYPKINELIATTYHMLNVFENSTPFMNSFSNKNQNEVDRITTLGILDLVSNEEKPFFSLDTIKQKEYYYGINEMTLQKDGSFMNKIREHVQKKKSENLSITYGIFPITQNYNCAFFKEKTSLIQTKERKNESL